MLRQTVKLKQLNIYNSLEGLGNFLQFASITWAILDSDDVVMHWQALQFPLP